MAKHMSDSENREIKELHEKLDVNSYVELKYQVLEGKIDAIVEKKIKNTISWFITVWSVIIAVLVGSFAYQAWNWIKTSTSKRVEEAFLQNNIQKTIEETAVRHAKTITEEYIADTVSKKIAPLQKKVEIIDRAVEDAEHLAQRIVPMEKRILNLQQKAENIESKMEELETFAKKDLYRPLSEKNIKKMVQKLKSIKNVESVSFRVVNGNDAGHKIVEDLIDMLSGLKINARYEGSSISFGVKNGLFVTVNQNTIPVAQELVDVLSILVKTPILGDIDPESKDGHIQIKMIGSPLFHKDGSVEIVN